MTLLGFCLAHQANVPISPDRRCLTDNSLCIPPSTLCPHRRITAEGIWSECSPLGESKPCKPQHPDTWRATQSQQARAEAKREVDQNKAAKALAPTTAKTDTKLLREARRDLRPGPRHLVCPMCTRAFTARSKFQVACSSRCGSAFISQRHRAEHPPTMIPCPVCGEPFEAKTNGHNRPKINCSQACAAKARRPKESARSEAVTC